MAEMKTLTAALLVWGFAFSAWAQGSENGMLPSAPQKTEASEKALVSSALALELDDEKEWAKAALEFRRLALAESDAGRAAGWYWLAAYEYGCANEWKRGWKFLDRAEAGDEFHALDVPLTWLRARQCAGEQNWTSAAFHFESLVRQAEGNDALRIAAARGAASAHLRDKNYDSALSALSAFPAGDAAESRAVLQAYAARADKKPWLGGVLGLIPGLGYVYSGEYANGLRSLLLNSLFLWAMVETAEDDEWALFAVSAFFEVTWYSGSIYGGIDAAHRCNQRRLDDAIQAIQSPASITPDWVQIPVISLQCRF